MFLNFNDINKLYSKTWIACNDNSRAKVYRDEFLSQHGGEFVKHGKYLHWQSIHAPEPVYVPRRLLTFINPKGSIVEIDNMSDYCHQHKLSKAAMYEVLRGVRNVHKGYRAPPIPLESQITT